MNQLATKKYKSPSRNAHDCLVAKLNCYSVVQTFNFVSYHNVVTQIYKK